MWMEKYSIIRLLIIIFYLSLLVKKTKYLMAEKYKYQ